LNIDDATVMTPLLLTFAAEPVVTHCEPFQKAKW
jgi:hypothetical protein